ncbi:hypothetical protein [Alicyclobacillus fastidiosus]|uniref:Integrase catalytic domain-containing protein n=1 Tax=Alicyclobacillus fastidiosus TaxID=392011 RepID=A0ABV5AJ03_9BACL|nr:hypothetical protein [Alicyclobacillus fastidiosus]WEH10039.1 hypothetical protein PYS47_01735 [Alicyclobacillus fastidiosus]
MSVTKFGDIPAFNDHWLDNQKGLCPMNEASVVEALYPLHIVEIDHVELDMNVADSNTGIVLGRPWVTLGIDAYSRTVWSMYVSLEPPSAITLRKAIVRLFFKAFSLSGSRRSMEPTMSGIFPVSQTFYR